MICGIGRAGCGVEIIGRAKDINPRLSEIPMSIPGTSKQRNSIQFTFHEIFDFGIVVIALLPRLAKDVSRSKHRSILASTRNIKTVRITISIRGELVKHQKGKGAYPSRTWQKRLHVLQSDISKIEQCQRRIEPARNFALAWQVVAGKAKAIQTLTEMLPEDLCWKSKLTI